MWLYSSLQWTGRASLVLCGYIAGLVVLHAVTLTALGWTPDHVRLLQVCSLLFLSVCAQDLALAQQVLSENAGDADLAIVELLQLMDLGPGT